MASFSVTINIIVGIIAVVALILSISSHAKEGSDVGSAKVMGPDGEQIKYDDAVKLFLDSNDGKDRMKTFLTKEIGDKKIMDALTKDIVFKNERIKIMANMAHEKLDEIAYKHTERFPGLFLGRASAFSDGLTNWAREFTLK